MFIPSIKRSVATGKCLKKYIKLNFWVDINIFHTPSSKHNLVKMEPTWTLYPSKKNNNLKIGFGNFGFLNQMLVALN